MASSSSPPPPDGWTIESVKHWAAKTMEKPIVQDPNMDKAIKGACALAALCLMFGYGAQLLCSFIGVAYPAYMSVKAIESPDKSDDTQWLMYWVVFAFFSLGEVFSDVLVGWVPFYWLLKSVLLLWCMSPLQGSNVIYYQLIRPYFLRHEGTIDDVVKKSSQEISRLGDTVLEKAKDLAAEEHLKRKDM